MTSKIIGLAIVFIYFFTIQLSAQNSQNQEKVNTQKTLPVKIKGQVIDSLTGESLPYVTLKIVPSEQPDQTIKLLSSDDVGKFDISINCPPGTYNIITQYVGKSPTEQPFEVKENEKQIDLGKIPVKDSQQLDEVVVSAVRPLVQVDLDKIAYNMEDDPDAKTNNVLEMLKKVPMITVDAQDKIELKGSSSYKIYMDGKPSNLISNNPSQVLKSMPANTVKKIEVITEPGAKYDSEGVTGIINIVTDKQLGGYTGTVNAGVNTLGGWDAGAYLSLKYGKIGFSGNYNYYKYISPSGSTSTYRENYLSNQQKYLNQNGSSSNTGNGQYGNGQLSYEIDTLNLISLSYGRYAGAGKSESDLLVDMQNSTGNTVYSYDQGGYSKYTYGSTDINLDYQRTFKKKDELLTASYLFSLSPNDSESRTEIHGIVSANDSLQELFNDADFKEHTFQLDYTTPLGKIHTIEGGAKYIIRLNESDGSHNIFNYKTNDWRSIQTDNDEFRHRQDILAAYLGYSLKYKTLGFKTGLRMEDTQLKAEYPLNTSKNFDNHYFVTVPSATISWLLKQVHTFRLGYNMRIQRPGIWYLNPYIESRDPKFVQQGNPDLDVEKYHNIDLSYNVFKPKFNINSNFYYNFSNNSIQRVTKMINDISYSTYDNIGKQNRGGVYVNASWNPTMKFRIYINANGSYNDIRANNGTDMKNSGFQGSVFSGLQYTFPYDFVLGLNGGYSSPYIQLESQSGSFYYTSISLSKSFLNKKLNLSLSGNDLFSKYRDYTYTQQTDQFYFQSKNQYESRQVRFSVSYTFGELKQQIQQVRRSISNDDAKAGESGGGASGGGGKQ